MLMIKGLIGGLFQVVMFGALLLIPAGLVPGGTWVWKKAIYFLIGYGILIEALIVWLCIVAPGGMEARFKKSPKDDRMPKEDKILKPLLILFVFAYFIIIPLDVFRFQIFPMPGSVWGIVGIALAVFGILFNGGALYSNAFITSSIQDQTDEGQKVADTGVYAIVRHPYYASLFPLFIGMSLWLESWVGVIALLPLLIVLIIRIGVEERTLKKTLPGYTEYTKKVKYKLMPFIW
ncbi:isoprenylcysteine carboxylmethyltransferase family protein [Candidatus Calescamantes bacterium]|nr:isoprenylcysteine carboxylmethyltransferase family protein [Candidatus Calescamantes bacterium]